MKITQLGADFDARIRLISVSRGSGFVPRSLIIPFKNYLPLPNWVLSEFADFDELSAPIFHPY